MVVVVLSGGVRKENMEKRQMSAFTAEIQAVKDGSARKGTLAPALLAFKKAVEASPEKATSRQKDIVGKIGAGMAMSEMITLQMAVVDSATGGRRHGKKTRKVRKTRKQVRKGRRTTRKLRGRGLFDMFSSKPKKLDAGLAGGVVPAGEIVSSIGSVADKDPKEISVSSILAYERGLKLLEAIAATNMSKYKKAYTLVQELSVNGGKVTLADETGEMHTAGVFDRDDIQQAASELKTALSSYKPETGEVV